MESVIDFYREALAENRKPCLLQYRLPRSDKYLSVCAIDPVQVLETRDNRLFVDGKYSGPALDIFDFFDLSGPKDLFFPAYLGFFSYEFAKYFSLASKDNSDFPDAQFRRYHRGLVLIEDKINQEDNFAKLTQQNLTPNISKDKFKDKIKIIKEEISAGNVYQVNLSERFLFEDPNFCALSLYCQMRARNMSPFMALLEDKDWSIISASPERLFAFDQNELLVKPIAGTKKRGEDLQQDQEIAQDLRSCPKENAEHAMLVDLMSNDLRKVAQLGSTKVACDRSVEFYSHVMHLVSEISCTSTASLKEIFQAIFPGGTISGAPKKSVMETIAKLEPKARGPYTGSMGYISSGFGVDFNILIRTVLKNKDQAWINAGAGIVIDSDEEEEWREINKKAQFVKDILAEKISAKISKQDILGEPVKNFVGKKFFSKSRVLFLENNDSFSYNIVDLLRSLGCTVKIASDCQKNMADYSHLILGPGPKRPEVLPHLGEQIDQAIKTKTPILGVCLGHQAIAYYFGGEISKRAPQHGKTFKVNHFDRNLFYGLDNPSLFTRYHSLVVKSAPKDFLVDAYSDDDCIMAISHKSQKIYGVQFHPESYLSQNGLKLIENFLRG